MNNGQPTPVFELAEASGEIITMRWIELILIALIAPFVLSNSQQSGARLANSGIRRLKSDSREWLTNRTECLACRMLTVPLFPCAWVHRKNDAKFDVDEITSASFHRTGILLLAHGGKRKWNEQVLELAAHVDKRYPTEVAFGMANRSSMEEAITRLIDRGVTEIVAVPLFISSYSSVMRVTEYLLGMRRAIPHRASGTGHHQQSQGGNGSLTPIALPVPTCMSRALDAHPLVAEILLDRARTLSRNPRREVVILVAHGPVADEDNAKWLAHMRKLADSMRIQRPFKRIEVITLRDDAPRPIRDRATAQLRTMVRNARAEGYRVLIVPLLISFGGIEQGIKQRLKGLDYVMSEEGLLPDVRLAEWVILSVEETRQKLMKDGRCLDSAIRKR